MKVDTKRHQPFREMVTCARLSSDILPTTTSIKASSTIETFITEF
jgi:hypothetical protein